MTVIPQVVTNEISKLRNIVDGIGNPIDEGIIFVVAVLRCHGFDTTASCEGHLERICPPWVNIQSLDAPKLLKIMQDGAHIGAELIKNRNAVVMANRRENNRLFNLLSEFYESKQLKYRTMLTVVETGPGYGKLTPHAGYLVDLSNSEYYATWLRDVQGEMMGFGEFLCGNLE